MTKRMALVVLICLMLTAVAFAAGGGADDPLISLSYLKETFFPQAEKAIDARLRGQAFTESGEGERVASGWTETRLKQGDALLGDTGSQVLLLAGEMQVMYPSGAVIDVTVGSEVPSGSTLTANHRYMVAENTTARFVVTSRTAVTDGMGGFDVAESDALDYNAIATALKKLNLFRGSNTGYGQGYDLERAPTRLQALIMFIRVLGEEEQALAWTEGTHFTDISPGTQGEKYVGYAYAKGYTNGYTATEFRPGNTVNAWQYVEFILRAMGYSSASNTNLSDALERGQEAGLLTEGEAAFLQTTVFLRADLVYLSYYALETALPDSRDTLGNTLMEKGVFRLSDWKEAQDLAEGNRLSP